MNRLAVDSKLEVKNMIESVPDFRDGIADSILDLTNHGYVSSRDQDKLYCIINESGVHPNISGDRIFNDIGCEVVILFPNVWSEVDYEPIQVIDDIMEQDEYLDKSNFMLFAMHNSEVFDKY